MSVETKCWDAFRTATFVKDMWEYGFLPKERFLASLEYAMEACKDAKVEFSPGVRIFEAMKVVHGVVSSMDGTKQKAKVGRLTVRK